MAGGPSRGDDLALTGFCLVLAPTFEPRRLDKLHALRIDVAYSPDLRRGLRLSNTFEQEAVGQTWARLAEEVQLRPTFGKPGGQHLLALATLNSGGDGGSVVAARPGGRSRRAARFRRAGRPCARHHAVGDR